eukprot:TRINITY_DN2664_c0_g1_i2.p2 TRINITY_DN2664_c0_g1~~TRINITY_DN2664_c0_g1_i2.p2  ORF type:complete len:163 (+),score=1.73 TRINITY_DN2664_c0_g1_i2:154-642(+)
MYSHNNNNNDKDYELTHDQIRNKFSSKIQHKNLDIPLTQHKKCNRSFKLLRFSQCHPINRVFCTNHIFQSLLLRFIINIYFLPIVQLDIVAVLQQVGVSLASEHKHPFDGKYEILLKDTDNTKSVFTGAINPLQESTNFFVSLQASTLHLSSQYGFFCKKAT